MHSAALFLACLAYAGRSRRIQPASQNLQARHQDDSRTVAGSYRSLASALLAMSMGRGLPLQVSPAPLGQMGQTLLPDAQQSRRDALHRISPHAVDSVLSGLAPEAVNISSTLAVAKNAPLGRNSKSFHGASGFMRAVFSKVFQHVDIDIFAMYVGVVFTSFCVLVSSSAKRAWGRGKLRETASSAPRASIRRAGVPVASIADENAPSIPDEEAKVPSLAEISIPLLASVGGAVLFAIGLYLFYSPEAGLEFTAGYVVEQSLSVDNIFVFLLIFNYFKVPKDLEAYVLSWGIFGAVVMRGLFIGLGALSLQNFHEVLLIFAAILLYSSYKLLVLGEEEEEDLENNAVISTVRRFVPAVSQYDGKNFFALAEDGKRAATPLLICLICIELSDIVFAVDSVPAVFGVTQDPVIVFSSNIFAILALRSLFSVLSVAVSQMKYLESAVALVLGFVGVKLVGEYFGMEMSAGLSVVLILSILSSGVVASLYSKDEDEGK